MNAAASEGQVAVDVLDEGGRPLLGCVREGCLLEALDSTRQEGTWRGKSDLTVLRDQPVRLRLYIQHADLYGFQIR